MARLTAKLRYYPGDLPENATEDEFQRLGRQLGVDITVEEIKNPATMEVSGEVREETDGVPLEKVSQTVITLEATAEDDLRRCLVELFGRIRSPRTAYAFWGSSPEGECIARRVAETNGGW